MPVWFVLGIFLFVFLVVLTYLQTVVSEIRWKQAEPTTCWLPDTSDYNRDYHYPHRNPTQVMLTCLSLWLPSFLRASLPRSFAWSTHRPGSVSQHSSPVCYIVCSTDNETEAQRSHVTRPRSQLMERQHGKAKSHRLSLSPVVLTLECASESPRGLGQGDTDC